MRSQHHCGYLCQHSYFHTLHRPSRVLLHSRVEHSPTTRRLHQEPKQRTENKRNTWEQILLSRMRKLAGGIRIELTSSKNRNNQKRRPAQFCYNHSSLSTYYIQTLYH